VHVYSRSQRTTRTVFLSALQNNAHNWNIPVDCSDIDYKEKCNLSLE
jgi:hypothetical protein